APVEIPDLQRFVLAAADEPPSVGADGQAGDRPGVALQGEQRRTLAGVPHPERPVVAAADDLPAIGTQRHTAYRAPVTPECEDLAPFLGVLDRHLVTPGGEKSFAILAPGNAGGRAHGTRSGFWLAVEPGPEAAKLQVAEVPLAGFQALDRSGPI